MYKNSALLAIGTALLVSLFFVDAGYAVQIVNRKPPVDFLTIAEMYGWTRIPWQVVGILFVGLVYVWVKRDLEWLKRVPAAQDETTKVREAA